MKGHLTLRSVHSECRARTIIGAIARYVATMAVLCVVSICRSAQAVDTIKLGAIYDLTGDLNIYGVQESRALHLAVDDVNARGGLLGRKIQVIENDAQSDLSKYTQYANALILRDHIAVLFAGLTSSSREAIRPIIRRSGTPYFYTALYEGGACDKQTFVTGPSASQQLSVLIKWSIARFGPRIYIMAPDYNFGRISATWVRKYAKEFGGEVVGADFLSLTVTDYSPTIQKIQFAKPNFVVTLPVGANQTAFIEQFAAAGLKRTIGLVSTNYGSGNQQVVVSPAAGQGIVTDPEYIMSIQNSENEMFKAKWEKAYGLKEPILGGAVNGWNAVHLWAQAVEKSRSLDPAKVINALESGLTYSGPNGGVALEPRSHHVRMNIYIAQANDHHGFDVVETYKAVAPLFEERVCDLRSNPETAAHFTPDSQ